MELVRRRTWEAAAAAWSKYYLWGPAPTRNSSYHACYKNNIWFWLLGLAGETSRVVCMCVYTRVTLSERKKRKWIITPSRVLLTCSLASIPAIQDASHPQAERSRKPYVYLCFSIVEILSTLGIFEIL
jgi:hypothetical protein